MGLTREAIVAAARFYRGVTFRHQGRTPHGLDCVGLLVMVARDLEIPHTDITGYARTPDGLTLQAALRANLIKKSIKDLQAGDVLCFALPHYPCHVGIYTEKGTIVHALSRVGMVTENTLDKSWKERIRECYEYPGIENGSE